MVWRSVYFMVKFQIFIELWDFIHQIVGDFSCRAVNWEPLGQFTLVCILFGEFSIFHSRVMGLYSSNCRWFFMSRCKLRTPWPIHFGLYTFWWNLNFSFKSYGKESLYKYSMNVDDGRIMHSWCSCLLFLFSSSCVPYVASFSGFSNIYLLIIRKNIDPPVTVNRSVKTFPYYSHSNWYLHQR
jgi:hypothetical protein